MENSIVGEYLLIALVPWLLGTITGGVMGGVCAYASHLLFSRRSDLLKPAAFLPWRTILAGLLLYVWSPVMLTRFGPVAVIGSIIALLTFGFTLVTLFEYWHPSPLLAVLVAGTRTFAVLSGVMAIAMAYLGGEEVKGFITTSMVKPLPFGPALHWWLIIIILIFFVDFLLGLGQWLACNAFEKKPITLGLSG